MTRVLLLIKHVCVTQCTLIAYVNISRSDIFHVYSRTENHIRPVIHAPAIRNYLREQTISESFDYRKCRYNIEQRCNVHNNFQAVRSTHVRKLQFHVIQHAKV